MLAVRWHGRGDVRVEEVPPPAPPGPGELQLQVRWCGICGTDLEEWLSGPVFIPAGEPQFNGSVENFNGWFQEPLFQRKFHRPGDLRRELARLQEAVNTQHVHPRLGGKTPAQHRRGLSLQKLPPASWCRRSGRRWPTGA